MSSIDPLYQNYPRTAPKKKKKNGRSLSSLVMNSESKKNYVKTRNLSNVFNNKEYFTLTNRSENKSEFSIRGLNSNKLFEYDRSRILQLLILYQKDLESKTKIYKKQQIINPKNQFKSIPKVITFRSNNDKFYTRNKISLISGYKKRDYLSTIFLYKKRKMIYFKNIIYAKIEEEVKKLVETYISINNNFGLSLPIQNNIETIGDYLSLSSARNRPLNTIGVATPKEKIIEDFIGTKFFPKKKAILTKHKNFKSTLTPFPKKKDQTYLHEVSFQKASGAANLIRRIEYSNYLKEAKEKYTKEVLNKSVTMIQRWWRYMLVNNTFYFKVIQMQRLIRGHRIRRGVREAKKLNYHFIPGVKNLTFVFFKASFEKIYNYLLNQYAYLYQYTAGSEQTEKIKRKFKAYLDRNAQIKKEMIANRDKFKQYYHLAPQFKNLTAYKNFIEKVKMLQRNVRAFLEVCQKKNGRYYFNKKVKKYVYTSQMSNIFKMMLRKYWDDFFKNFKSTAKLGNTKSSTKKRKALNRIFRRYSMKTQFEKYLDIVNHLRIRENLQQNFMKKLISVCYLRPFYKGLNKKINKKKRNILLSRKIRKNDILPLKNAFHLLKHLTLYGGGTIKREMMRILKFVFKKDLLIKRYYFDKYAKLSKSKLPSYRSGLLILKNVLLKKISAYFFQCKNGLINKPKKLRRVTKIFTNENSKIYFVSGKSVIHTKLKKIVKAIIKQQATNFKFYFLKYRFKVLSARKNNSVSPSKVKAAPRKETSNSTKTYNNDKPDPKSMRIALLRSFIKRKEEISRANLLKGFLRLEKNVLRKDPNRRKSLLRNKRVSFAFINESVKRERIKVILTIAENKLEYKQFYTLAKGLKSWMRRAKKISIIKSTEMIQKNFRLKLGPAKRFALTIKHIFMRHFFRKNKA